MTQSELYTYARRLVNANSNDWTEANLVIDFNDALSDIWVRIKNIRGVLEFDDSTYNDQPSGTYDVVAGTSAYKITTDENANDIYTVHKVAFLDGTKWVDIPRKVITEDEQAGLLDTASDTQTIPDFYYEVGNNIIFSPIPDTNIDEGVKIWFDREPERFAVGGTTFVAGIPSLYHSLIAEKSALKYAVIKNLKQAANIMKLVEMGEKRLDEYEGNRRRDEHKALEVANHSNK